MLSVLWDQALTKEAANYMVKSLKNHLKNAMELDSNTAPPLYDTESDTNSRVAQQLSPKCHSPSDVSMAI